MNLTRYTSPWFSLNQLQNEVNQLFHRQLISPEDGSNVETSQWMPLVDIREEKDKFIVAVDVPGIEPDKIEISVDNNLLMISGIRTSQTKEENREGYLRIERSSGTFCRRFSLPDSADLDNIQAKNKHGELIITIPKREAKVSRRIEVKVD